MKVYVFGNPDSLQDNQAIQAVKKLKKRVNDVEFVMIKPNEDLSFADESNVVIMDAVQGIQTIQIFNENDIEKLTYTPRNSVHDFDLGFQLKYLKKLGKLKHISIIGLPINKEVDYDSLHSILRKLVAQDMQGS
jgi:Ni,Fe-hydrogenase maturation factor